MEQSVVKNIPKCEKSGGKEEKAETFRCDNYVRLLGTGRRVLLAPICVPSAPDPSPSATTNIPFFFPFLSHPQTIVLKAKMTVVTQMSPPNGVSDISSILKTGFSSLWVGGPNVSTGSFLLNMSLDRREPEKLRGILGRTNCPHVHSLLQTCGAAGALGGLHPAQTARRLSDVRQHSRRAVHHKRRPSL